MGFIRRIFNPDEEKRRKSTNVRPLSASPSPAALTPSPLIARETDQVVLLPRPLDRSQRLLRYYRLHHRFDYPSHHT